VSFVVKALRTSTTKDTKAHEEVTQQFWFDAFMNFQNFKDRRINFGAAASK
jgi:hypothetical protein